MDTELKARISKAYALVGIGVVFAIEEARADPYRWRGYAVATYALMATIFAVRWFVSRRKRA